MFFLVYLCLRQWNPISADFSKREPLGPLSEIQWQVRARYEVKFPDDHTSAVRLIRPGKSYLNELCKAERRNRHTASSRFKLLNHPCHCSMMPSWSLSRWGISLSCRFGRRSMQRSQNLGHSTTRID